MLPSEHGQSSPREQVPPLSNNQYVCESEAPIDASINGDRRQPRGRVSPRRSALAKAPLRTQSGRCSKDRVGRALVADKSRFRLNESAIKLAVTSMLSTTDGDVNDKSRPCLMEKPLVRRRARSNPFDCGLKNSLVHDSSLLLSVWGGPY
jgi:hypothetical protein